ncbi:MFS transporter [Streptomyces sp. NBC_01267]|uniref:MFS transporter n=1 Tax=unclassified Streptomyces TaxID=2593676 RepID=UPI00224D9498|nr:MULTISPECIES: MFS transporter [unclassified Streptomyces]MCX4549774.1 MFS transporter [Streptomyces sp. NBC_01500]WSV55237.1 MFS transporter [Streptomyces sp. NBC_01014]
MSSGAAAPATNGVARRAVVAASFGNAMEWYDFTVFAFFAGYISDNFFRDDDPGAALISTFVVFGTGFVARPLGAVVMGLYGDRKGRKAAMMLSLSTMAVGTLLLVVAPPVTVIGIGAPVLLLAGRLLQGFSAGGEIGGATAFLVEHAPPDRRARYAAWLQASMGICNLAAAAVGVTLTTFVSESAMSAWAWRIPFALGLLIIPVGVYIRRHLPETEEFEKVQPAKPAESPGRGPLVQLLTVYRGRVVTGFLFSVLWTVCVYTLVIYAPTYYESDAAGLGFTTQQSFLASLVGNAVLVVGCLVAGRAADRAGAQRVIVAGALALLVLPFPLLAWLHAQPALPVLLLVHCLLCAGVAAFAGVAPSTLTRLFPVAVRSTGVALSYNLAATLFAGFTPALMAWAVASLTVYAPALWVAGAAVACLAAAPALFRQIQPAAGPRPPTGGQRSPAAVVDRG